MKFIIYNKGSWVGFVRVKSDAFLNMPIPMPTGFGVLSLIYVLEKKN